MAARGAGGFVPPTGQYCSHSSSYPYDPRSRPSFPQPEVGGFYNPALSGAVQQAYPHPQQPYRGHPAPTQPHPPANSYLPVNSQPDTPSIPHVLQPGGSSRSSSIPTRTNSADLFFQTPTGNQLVFPQPGIAPQHHPTHPPIRQTHSSPGPPVPQKPYVAPPLPPKPSISLPPASGVPSLYPEQIIATSSLRPEAHAGPSSQPIQRNAIKDHHIPPQAAKDPDEDTELKRALELSAKECEEQQRKAMSQEDEELERALQESLKLSSSPGYPFPITSSPSRVDFPSPSLGSFSDPSSSSSFPGPSSSSSVPSNTPGSACSIVSEFANDDIYSGTYTASPKAMREQIAADEAFARRLLEDETEVRSKPMPQHPSHVTEHDDSSRAPPLYNEVVTNAPRALSAPVAPSTSSSSSPLQGPTSSLSTATPSRGPSPEPSLGRNGSAASHGSRSGRSQSVTASTGRDSLAAPSTNEYRLSSPSLSNLTVAEEPRERRPSFSARLSEPPLTANQFIDADLLQGVSLGFGSPAISSALTPMQGPIPNVVALPYGKCPPFHVKAPSWKDLMKLMARLSGTRLEPTIEAMSVVKTEMKIRVVVNFVKVHQSSTNWHVALYVTIDYPVPENHPYAYKYKNGDPNVLPYSYSLSPMPAFLRDGADAPMSKWFTIPPTPANPLKKLPIAFPDLAGHLLSVLSESRGMAHDSSSGMRRLGKLIDSCYPNEQPVRDEDERERRGLFDRFIRRNHRQSRDRNADTYDVVTPFYPDEFGA